MNDPLKIYRRQMRVWLKNGHLQKERDYYLRVFEKKGLKVPDEETLRAEMRTRFPQIIPKQKGSLDIIAIYHHYNWENYSLKPALENFGSVRHYDWANDEKLVSPKKTKKSLNKVLLETIRKWLEEREADFIFMYISGETIEPETMASLRVHGIPMMNLALNDKEHFVGKIRSGRASGARDICRYFDLCWTSTEDALIKYRVEGALPIYLPEGANPKIHKPYNLEKNIDISFVGQCYGNRTSVIDELRKRGIQVETYGYGWQNGPVDVEEMVKIYSRSKINLGFGGVESYQNTFCLKGRDFEVPMSGGLYLTEKHPELTHAYLIDQEIITYTGIDELEQKIHYYLEHPAEADAIRERGLQRALREHTWEGRFEKIFRLYGLLL